MKLFIYQFNGTARVFDEMEVADDAIRNDEINPGATGGLAIGHVSPEAAAGGLIALIAEGDTIEIDIPGRRINLKVDQPTLEARQQALEAGEHGYRPAAPRRRRVSQALRAYAAFASSADTRGVRDLSKQEGV